VTARRVRSRWLKRAGLGLVGAGLLATGLVLLGSCGDRRDARPNIVFVLADDHRYDFLGAAGHPWLETPNLDRLATEGVRFAQAFVTTSLCSPSRASFLTGQYAHRHGVVANETTDLGADVPTFPQLLQVAGYRTAFVGKWHMARWARPRPGFDRWVAFSRQGDYQRNTLNVDGAWVLAEGYVTDVLTDYALDFLADSDRRPFLLCLSHKAVHQPFTPAPRHADLYRDAPVAAVDSLAAAPAASGRQDGTVAIDRVAMVRDYARTLAALDESLGRILAALEARGILDNTVVIYAGDNGYLFGDRGGLWDKRVAYDPSIRIPLIVRYPPRFPAGTVCDELALNLDVAPTLLTLAGVPLPAAMQGRDLLALADGTATRDAFLYEYFADTGQVPTILALRSRQYKLVTYPENRELPDELYDLARDPAERRDLAADPAAAAVLADLRARLAARAAETGFRPPARDAY